MLQRLFFKDSPKRCPWCHVKIIDAKCSKKKPAVCPQCQKKSYLPEFPYILVDLLNLIYCYPLFYLLIAREYVKLATLTLAVLFLGYFILQLWPLKKLE